MFTKRPAKGIEAVAPSALETSDRFAAVDPVPFDGTVRASTPGQSDSVPSHNMTCVGAVTAAGNPDELVLSIWDDEGGASRQGERRFRMSVVDPVVPDGGPSDAAELAHSDHGMTPGTIVSLRPGGFGFIASDAHTTPYALPFRRAAVAGGGFDRLHAGQHVRFERVPVPGNPGRHHAVRVTPRG
jgi:cold shock CspA family protein